MGWLDCGYWIAYEKNSFYNAIFLIQSNNKASHTINLSGINGIYLAPDSSTLKLKSGLRKYEFKFKAANETGSIVIYPPPTKQKWHANLWAIHIEQINYTHAEKQR